MTLDDDRLDSLIRRDLGDGTEGWTAPAASGGLSRWARFRVRVPAIAAVAIAAVVVLAMGSAIFSLATAGGRSPLATIFTSRSASSSPAAAGPSAIPSGSLGLNGGAACPSIAPTDLGGCGGATGPAPGVEPSSPPSCPPNAVCAQPASPAPTPCTYMPTTTGGRCGPTPAPSTSPGSECGQSEAEISVATDKQTYAHSDYVNATGTIHNHSARACVVMLHSNCNPILEIDGPDGQTYYRSFPKGSMQPCRLGDAVTLQPGQSASETWTWYAGNCPPNSQPGQCSTTYAPTGTYSVILDWSPYGEARTTFTRT